MDLNRVYIILPSLDPDEKLNNTIDGLLSAGFSRIILVNDGSKEENLHHFNAAARHTAVTLLHHPKNLGKGAALKTAFSYILDNCPDCVGVVTVDGDGQHHPQDTLSCAVKMLQTGHLTLGVRDFNQPNIPVRSRFGNKLTSFIFKFFVGLKVSDTQTGLRAIPANLLPAMLAIAGDRFEYETNMLLSLKKDDIPFEQVCIRTVYIEENKSSHFRVVRDSWRIYKLILAHFFRYTACSLTCSGVDEVLFIALSFLLQISISGFALTATATVGARAASSMLNFFLNKKLVFQSNVPTKQALLRYYALAVPIALAQMGLTHGMYLLFGIPESQVLLRAVIYAIVMVALYLVSFLAQQRWVFHKKQQSNP